MRRSCFALLAQAAKTKTSLATSSTNTTSDDDTHTEKGTTTEQLSTYVPTASEAPELLQPYVEPTPFVSAKRLQVFCASLGVGLATICSAYYLVSKSMSINQEEEHLHVQSIVESNRLAMMDPKSLIPDFTAPSSFNELKEKMRQHERELERQQAEINRNTVMLHTEAVFRMKVWWNKCLTHLQEAFDEFGVAIQKRKERAAVANIKDVIDAEGYELVNLRNGKTHIW
ncbi:uncharacterized protein TM35_000042210 [Trypanosoma theileri]|uniref:Uncharacterized protein n=1 Tax=Trypanosoma theileri TaxID=67003 RepID=A0A1X0P4Y8_9TRYP|nr:uncharacterized protein TM35_000042210 [Trypanosoma theileri]ORC92007.1 hypothetical protein TM35_000042210 [Trypanosoma theileri]